MKRISLHLPRTSYMTRVLVATHVNIIFQLLMNRLLNYLFHFFFFLSIKVSWVVCCSLAHLLSLVTPKETNKQNNNKKRAMMLSIYGTSVLWGFPEVTAAGSETFLASAFSVLEQSSLRKAKNILLIHVSYLLLTKAESLLLVLTALISTCTWLLLKGER